MSFVRMGIRVNAVVPGFIDTPMTSTVPEKVKASLLQLVAMGRMGRPEGKDVEPTWIVTS